MSDKLILDTSENKKCGIVKIGISKNGTSIENNDITSFISFEIKNNNCADVKIEKIDGRNMDFKIPKQGSQIFWVRNIEEKIIKKSLTISGKYLSTKDPSRNIWVYEDFNFSPFQISIEGKDACEKISSFNFPSITEEVSELKITPRNYGMSSCTLKFNVFGTKKELKWDNEVAKDKTLFIYVNKNWGKATMFKATGTNPDVSRDNRNWYLGQDVETQDQDLFPNYEPEFGTSWGKKGININCNGFGYLTLSINEKKYKLDGINSAGINNIYLPKDVNKIKNIIEYTGEKIWEKRGWSWGVRSYGCEKIKYRYVSHAVNINITSQFSLIKDKKSYSVVSIERLGKRWGIYGTTDDIPGSDLWDWNSYKQYI